MPDVNEGTPYEMWQPRSVSEDTATRRAAEYEMVRLFDAQGRPQRVRGTSVKGQLAKRIDGEQVFFTSDPTYVPQPEPEAPAETVDAVETPEPESESSEAAEEATDPAPEPEETTTAE